jgi:HD-like signal output (HDOD) protein
MTAFATALTETSRPPLVQRLMEELEQLPATRAAALRVVQVVDDPATGAADVAMAASADPGLTARMLRVANSAYYGLSGRVGNPVFAVTVLGFQTVRSLAALSAAGLVGADALPEDFWGRAAAVASGASLLARRVGADAPEAFCSGLLHDLGSALLRRNDPAVYDAMLEQVGPNDPLLRLERTTYGGTHASLCSDVLGAWHFPVDLCEAIGRHHDRPSMDAPPVRRALQAAIALVIEPTSDDPDPGAALFAAHVRPDEVAELQRQVFDAAEELSAAFVS